MSLPSSAQPSLPSVVPAINAVKAQFANPPDLESIVRTVLGEAIAHQYPSLKIDLQRTRLATPRAQGGWAMEPFMPRVLDYLGSGTALDLSPVNAQSFYLSDAPPAWLKSGEDEPDMKVIETLVKQLSWRLPLSLQNALSDFWADRSDTGISRWQWLSDVIRDTLSIGALQQPDLADKARQAIDQVINCPEREDRIRQYGENAIRAYWLRATIINAGVSKSVLSQRIVLTGTDLALIWKANASTLSFKDLDQVAKDWSSWIGKRYVAQEIRVRSFEIDGNVFDAHAAALLNRQLEDLSNLKLPAGIGWQALQTVYRDITDPSAFFLNAPQASPQTLEALKQLLPAWLKNASLAEQALYRQYSVAWACTKKRSNGRTFLSDIADIRSYAADALQQQMQREQLRFEQHLDLHAAKQTLNPDDIELTFHTAAGFAGTIGMVERVKMSLTDLALKNLFARPKGSLTLRHRLGLSLPEWLTPDYITRRNGLIEQVDIGKVYPQRLEDLLLGNTPDARKREQLFARHLRVQLPLQALELSLKQESGVTPLGARYVGALVKTLAEDREVDGQPVVIRNLALARKPEAVADVVSNMYIIEPDNMDVGPHLLYRPLYAQSLIQYPTRAALLDAIAQPGEVQDSVLIWLSDLARPIYDNGGFKEPHYVRFGLGSEFAPIEVPQPARLATSASNNELLQYLHNGQLMQLLYGNTARALVDQANADSVSNSESRWGVLLEGAGLIFNSLLLLPALPRPLMLTGWLLSLASSASQDIPELASDDPSARELAAADVLLNVGMLLFHLAAGAVTRDTHRAKALKAKALRPFAPARIAEQWPEPPPPKIVEGAVTLAGEFPNAQSTVLDFSFSSARNRLTPSQRERLDRFKVALRGSLPPAALNGAHKGLYRIQQSWHVLLDHELYPVYIDQGGSAVIVAPTDTRQQGPALKSDGNGNWSLDLRLRLQGGMAPSRIAALQQKKAERIKQLEAELQASFRQEDPLQKAVEITHAALQRAQGDTRFTNEQLARFREKFDDALQASLNYYQHMLDSNQERIELQIPFHERIVISLLESLFDNRVSALASSKYEKETIIKQWPQFTRPGPEMEQAADLDPQGFRLFIKALVALNERTIDRLELRNSYIEQLYNLSNAGSETAYRLAADIPTEELTSLSLKSFQLDCLKLASSKITSGKLIERTLDTTIDPLKEYLRTHDELNSLEFDASKRLAVLDSLAEQYGQALDALEGISIVNADELEIDYFNKLRQLLEELYLSVVKQLAAEIKPPQTPRKRPRKRTPSAAGKPQKKVINTRGKGPLIGDLKPAGNEWPIEVIEIRSGYDNQLLSTYSQHGDEWVEIRTVQPEIPPATRALNVIKGDARKLFDRFDELLRKGRQFKVRCRHPIEVEELHTHEATKLDKLATELHFALQSQPLASRLPSDQVLVDNMRDGARRLISQGQELRTQLSLQLPPTDGNLRYLLAHERVQIAGLGERIQLQGEHRDFIQEYAINDSQGYPLWYAHFHYEQADVPRQNYTVAHLKTKAQRKLSYYSQLANAQGGQAIVNVHRGQIGKALAERWFLPLDGSARQQAPQPVQ